MPSVPAWLLLRACRGAKHAAECSKDAAGWAGEATPAWARFFLPLADPAPATRRLMSIPGKARMAPLA